jgi:hypothetical protein
MPRVGLELTILVFERAKTVRVLDCAATVSSWGKEIERRLLCFKIQIILYLMLIMWAIDVLSAVTVKITVF